ncbi:hypothetical protein V2J09_016327 [Rumex salicifolius]
MEEGTGGGFCIQAKGFHHGGGGGGGVKCGRWNPTAEQVKVLTELFRAGLRTPSTDQIQKISAQLSFYGKIESKNVFYWFQNHKARERQKRRRVSRSDHNQNLSLSSSSSPSPPPPPSKYYCQKNQICKESERVIETLQLFPLRSYDEYHHHHTELRKECKEKPYAPFSYPFNGKEMPHPHLDLRLSFL